MRLSLDELTEMARRCRTDIVRMTNAAGSGHPGGSLSAIDLMVALYGTNLRFRVDDPEWGDRDRFILSKGHASPAMYAILHQMGVLDDTDIMGFRKSGSVCQGHVDMSWTNGVDFSGGSLGMGMSFGLGCAIAAKMDGSQRRVWVMIGDGETQEGQVWEAAMAASHHHVDRLTALIDRNGIQNDDFTHATMVSEPLDRKYESFGWAVMSDVDGHDVQAVEKALQYSHEFLTFA